RRPKRALAGGVASQTEIPRGCAFAERCPRAAARCREARPELEIRETAHRVACFFPEGGA
ncbi:MAG: peptide ABC transporter substrate-binding protein, partial [Alphaproteobacteria bacterium]|nr:peptide ABC transporter substrate-binding protein [Alphaproteobacteria bacterium]